MRILLVEDDMLIGETVKAGLELDDHAVDWVKKGEEALGALRMSDCHEAMILDIGLPGISGIETLKIARKEGHTIPTIILTARGSVSDRVLGLDVGADDYLPKPFDMDELLARIRTITRRNMGHTSNEFTAGIFRANLSEHEIFLENEKLSLTRKEYVILLTLLEAEGRTLTREFLENSLYAWNSDIESNTVEVYVSKLRKKVGRERIKTVRGIGYAMELQ